MNLIIKIIIIIIKNILLFLNYLKHIPVFKFISPSYPTVIKPLLTHFIHNYLEL